LFGVSDEVLVEFGFLEVLSDVVDLPFELGEEEETPAEGEGHGLGGLGDEVLHLGENGQLVYHLVFGGFSLGLVVSVVVVPIITAIIHIIFIHFFFI
jgi:hypothetical protein